MVAIKKWFLAGSVAFGVGFSLSLLTMRDIKKAILTGLIVVPSSYAGCLVLSDRKKSAEFNQSLLPVKSALNQLQATLNSHIQNIQEQKTEFNRSLLSITPIFDKFTPAVQEQDITEKQIEPFKNNEVAIFWDYENIKAPISGIKAPLVDSIITYSHSKGNLKLKKVYSNWIRENELVVQTLYSLGFEPIHVSMGKQNSVDVKITVDCLNAAYQYPNLKHFILVTADKDFIPLVNTLKMMNKQVTLICREETVSEHLRLSVNEFLSVESLLGINKVKDSESITKQKLITISYEEAIKYLIAAIILAQKQGKSTRFPVIDRLMRICSNSIYQGVVSIRKNEILPFSKFATFIEIAEREGKVKIKTVDGFPELHLVEDSVESNMLMAASISQEESENIEEQAWDNNIEREHWLVIIDQVKKVFEEGKPGPTFGRFWVLRSYVRKAKKNGELEYSNEILEAALHRLVKVGVLVKQDNGSFRLVENFEHEKEEFLTELMKA